MVLFSLLTTPAKTMRFYKLFIIFSIFSLLSACTEKAEDQVSEDIHPSFSELPEVSEESSTLSQQRVIPVQFSPEDQTKADKAPEGMVFIKGGCFIMGNDYTQEDEKPEHEVCLDGFYMDRHEVTQARWEKIMGFNPSKFVGANLPVEQVNFLDCLLYTSPSPRDATLSRMPSSA